jgi:uncharacterized protein YegP (UPF0339 family)
MKIECSEGSSGVWSWRFKSDTGDTVIAEGTKTFETREEAKKAITAFASTVGVKANAVSYVPLVPDEDEDK